MTVPTPAPWQLAAVDHLNHRMGLSDGDVRIPPFIEVADGEYVYVVTATLAERLAAIELAVARGQHRLAERMTIYSDHLRKSTGDLQEF